ncbi:hypothetical protein AK88_05403 [Plasmodium fragile]|uniref:Uncharacterized protein n=1 Tax=Plasmodium fragile TaxID=5857 RepID=A0A0D9QDB2_PLAFR|nr:uncharacterized protein AK88_05403 [Plasmodium fragile]KJP84964.1 hypothetical protein AK88_05403 [Plasmodium fragile]
MTFLASTIGTSSGNGTSEYGTDVGTAAASTIATTSVSLSDATDVGKRGQRNFYDGQSTSRRMKNTVFDDMRRKLKSTDKVKKPQHKSKSSQDITAGDNCRRGLKKWTRCKMGRKAWLALILVLSVLYAFFMSSLGQSVLSGIFRMILGQAAFATFMGTYGAFILIVIVYFCVLICFCCSKTAKCVLDKIWKKKEKEEAPTETEKNEGEVNKKPAAPTPAAESQKPHVHEKKEESGESDVPSKPDVSNKRETSGVMEAPKKPEIA